MRFGSYYHLIEQGKTLSSHRHFTYSTLLPFNLSLSLHTDPSSSGTPSNYPHVDITRFSIGVLPATLYKLIAQLVYVTFNTSFDGPTGSIFLRNLGQKDFWTIKNYILLNNFTIYNFYKTLQLKIHVKLSPCSLFI